MHRLSAILFSLATFSIVMGLPGRNLRPRDDCNVDQVTHCCQETTTSTTDEAHAIQALQALGFPVDPNAIVVGKGCTKHDPNTCTASPVCCSGNINHDTAWNCSPVNQNGPAEQE